MLPIVTYHREPINAYRLIIHLPETVQHKVHALQQALHTQNGGIAQPLVTPYIYLCVFEQSELDETPLTDALYKIALGCMPFKIHLKNFDAIAHSELYIDIANKHPLQLLLQQLKVAGNYMLHPQFNEWPRVSLLRNIAPLFFETYQKWLQQQSFSATFVAGGMLLLKRMPGFKAWQLAGDFTFQNQWIL